MKRDDLDRFFSELASRWTHPTTVRLLGGAGSLVLGGARPTMDVDFEVHVHSPKASWESFEDAMRATMAETKIGAQYAESVDRWSQITFLDYRRHTRSVKQFGAIEVRVLEPGYWSIGKIGRYWDQDIQDMIAVFTREQPDPVELARLWSRAIAESPRSTQLSLVKRQALHFFETFGRRIWGDAFSIERIHHVFTGHATRN